MRRGREDRQHHAGEACAGAHVDDALALRRDVPQQRGAVQQVQRGDILRLGDGGQVHHLVFLQQQGGVGLQLRYGVVGQSQLRKPAL